MSYAPTSDMREKPHALYRVFTKDGDLLYVGCSMTPLNRVTAHCKRQPWRRLIASVQVEWHETWDKAREAEAVAIRDEMPIWNVHHKPSMRIRTRGIYHPEYREDDPSTWIVRVSA